MKEKDIEKIEELKEEKMVVEETQVEEEEKDISQEKGFLGIDKIFEKEIETSKTLFYKGSLRSGKRLEAEGSIVIIGDVNSGAEVMATENIVILGVLRGLAHAGTKGNQKAIIATEGVDTVQIRIANIVKKISREDDPIYDNCYIHVQDNEVLIDV